MRETVITRDMVANPKTKYGNAKASTRHFITQRLTGAINIVFIGLLLYVVVRLAGQDRPDMVAVLGNGWIGLPLAALLVVVTVHMRNGMRDTLEDYFHDSLYRLLMLLNTLFCILVAVAGVAALLKLVFWG
ncbi:MAG: succinate dehydrogenase, hydrophobic membrane anchor protein [Devosia sp.]